MRQRLFPVELKIDIDCYYYYKPNHFVNTPLKLRKREIFISKESTFRKKHLLFASPDSNLGVDGFAWWFVFTLRSSISFISLPDGPILFSTHQKFSRLAWSPPFHAPFMLLTIPLFSWKPFDSSVVFYGSPSEWRMSGPIPLITAPPWGRRELLSHSLTVVASYRIPHRLTVMAIPHHRRQITLSSYTLDHSWISPRPSFQLEILEKSWFLLEKSHSPEMKESLTINFSNALWPFLWVATNPQPAMYRLYVGLKST